MTWVVGQPARATIPTGIEGETFEVAKSRDPNGDPFLTSAAITDIGDGDYEVVFTPDTDGPYWARLLGESGGGEWTIDWDVVTAQQADPVATLTTRAVTLTSPLNPTTGTLTLRKGNAYSIANGLAPTFDATGFPSMLGDTVEWRAIRDGRVRVTKNLTVVDADTARLEMATTDTDKLHVGASYTYEVTNTTDDVTIATGSLVVQGGG